MFSLVNSWSRAGNSDLLFIYFAFGFCKECLSLAKSSNMTFVFMLHFKFKRKRYLSIWLDHLHLSNQVYKFGALLTVWLWKDFMKNIRSSVFCIAVVEIFTMLSLFMFTNEKQRSVEKRKLALVDTLFYAWSDLPTAKWFLINARWRNENFVGWQFVNANRFADGKMKMN